MSIVITTPHDGRTREFFLVKILKLTRRALRSTRSGRSGESRGAWDSFGAIARYARVTFLSLYAFDPWKTLGAGTT